MLMQKTQIWKMEGRPEQILFNLLLFFFKLNHAYLAYLTAQALEMEQHYTYSKFRCQLNLIMIIIQNQRQVGYSNTTLFDPNFNYLYRIGSNCI